MPSGFSTHPAVIVGGGLSGLFVAASLQHQGVPYVLLERGDLDRDVEGHVLLYPEALDTLEAWGVPLTSGLSIGRVRGPAGVVPARLLAVQVATLRRAVLSRLTGTLRGRCEMVRVQPEEERVLVDVRLGDSMSVEVLEAALVVACDGPASLVRRRLKLGFDQVQDDRAWVVAEVAVEAACDEVRLGVSWARAPLADGRERWVLELADGEDGFDLDQPGPLTAAARERMQAPRASSVHCFRYFSMQDRAARDWRSGRVRLAGRAAHLVSPLWDLDASLSVADAARILDESYGSDRRAAVERIILPDAGPTAWLKGGGDLSALLGTPAKVDS